MSLTSYRTALPRDKVCVLYIICDNSQIKKFLDGFFYLMLTVLNYAIFIARMSKTTVVRVLMCFKIRLLGKCGKGFGNLF